MFEFSQEDNARSFSIIAHPCAFLPEKGFVWRNIDDLEEKYFLSNARRFIFRNAHVVTIDGRRYPPNGAEPCYRVEISRSSIDSNFTKYFKGSKHFNTQREFYRSFGQWLFDHQPAEVGYRESRDGIIVDVPMNWSAETRSQLAGEILIQVGWIDEEGEFQAGPLPLSDRKYFMDRNSMLLQWLRDVEDDAPISPFEPGMKIISQVELRDET